MLIDPIFDKEGGFERPGIEDCAFARDVLLEMEEISMIETFDISFAVLTIISRDDFSWLAEI